MPDLDLDFFNEIIFTSHSTVRNFKKRYRERLKNVRIGCIGEVTKNEAGKFNLL